MVIIRTQTERYGNATKGKSALSEQLCGCLSTPGNACIRAGYHNDADNKQRYEAEPNTDDAQACGHVTSSEILQSLGLSENWAISI